jgi:hypothetical protein
MITYSEFFTFCLFVLGIIDLIITIISKKK